MDALVLYHYPCPDGIFAALAAKLYHQATNQSVKFMPNTVYAPLKYDRRLTNLPQPIWTTHYV